MTEARELEYLQRLLCLGKMMRKMIASVLYRLAFLLLV
jgi:hypothetical protein